MAPAPRRPHAASRTRAAGRTSGRATPDQRPPDRFTTRVLTVVSRIPPGRVATYGDVAQLAGRPRAWRAVGNIMRTCHRPDIPCHRVIAAGGRLGGYGGNEGMKRALLVAEGVVVSGGRIRGLSEVRWAAASRRTGRKAR